MTDYEDELFVYKYRPKTLKDIDRPMVSILNKIVEKDTIPNFILYGKNGTGKKTLLYSFLKSRYGDFKTQCIHKEHKINTKKVIIPVFYSPYHVEIDIRTFLSHVRTILPVLIKEFAQTKNILNNRHKLFVIHHLEDLEMQTQHTLRRILEIYMDNCRFIFICSKLNNVTHPLQSRCLIIRVPVFTNPEIHTILSNVNKTLVDKVSNKDIDTIVQNCNNNIKMAMFDLEAKYYNIEVDVFYEKEAEELIRKIMTTKKTTFLLYEEIDDYLYKNLYKNRCLQDLIQSTFMCLRKILKDDYEILNEILKSFTLYDLNMVQGSRNYMHIQAVFYYLVNYFQNKNVCNNINV